MKKSCHSIGPLSNNIIVSVISNSHAFALLRDEWNELLETSNQNTIFLRWEWLYNWWQVYGVGSHHLCIYTARKYGVLIGIAPLYVKKTYNFFNEIVFLGSNIVCSDHLDFILHKRTEAGLVDEILSAIARNHLWDAIELRNLSSTSTIIGGILAFFPHNRVFVDSKNTICPYIQLTLPWETIFSAYSPVIKNCQKRKSKKLEKLHKISYYETASDSDAKNMYPHFLGLNKMRFEHKKMLSPFCDAKFAEFHEKIISDPAWKDMLRLGFLKADDSFIAGIYLLTYNNSYCYYQSGFDPAWESYSPGTLLLHDCIKTAHERGAKEFDFLQGNEKYKSNWTKTVRYNTKLRIYNNNFRSLWLYSILALKSYFIKFMRSIQSHVAVFSFIKTGTTISEPFRLILRHLKIRN